MARWVLAPLVVCLVHASAAVAATRSAPTIANLTLSGALAITWHGDPARGCAAEGLCGIRGELILRSEGSQGYASSGGLSGVSVDVSGTVRVRDNSESPAGECVDVMNGNGAGPGPAVELDHRRSWTAALFPPASSGRCAGPLATDLTHLALPVRAAGGRYPSFDMRGTRGFSAGPFSGTAASTMELRTSPGSGGFSSGSSAPSTVSTRRVLTEYVNLRYRVSIVASTVGASFSGSPDPICVALDSCGTSGSVGFSAQPSTGNLTLTGFRTVPTRASRSHALRDLRAGRLVLLPSGVPAPGEVTETLTWPDGSSCADTVARVASVLFGDPRLPSGGTLPVSVLNNGDPNVDLFRTHCPGPADTDIVGQNEILASGSLTPGQLLSKHTAVTLENRGGLTGLGYVGERTGSITVELTLAHLGAGTEVQQR